MKFKYPSLSLGATNHPPSPWQKAVQSGEGRLDLLCICPRATGEEYSFCFPYLLQAASVNNEAFAMQVLGQGKSKPWVTTCYKHSSATNLQNKTEQNTLELSIWNQWFAVHRTKPCPWPRAVCSRDILYTRCQLLPPSASWRQETKVSYRVHCSEAGSLSSHHKEKFGTSGNRLPRQRPSKPPFSGSSHPSCNLKIYQTVPKTRFPFSRNCSWMFKASRSPLFCAMHPVRHGEDSLTEGRIWVNLTACSLLFL